MTTTYTKEELKALEKTMEPFRINKTLRDGTKVSYIDTDAYLIHQKIFAPGKHGYGPSVVELRINDYEEFQEKLEQLQKLKGKREYAQKINEMPITSLTN